VAFEGVVDRFDPLADPAELPEPGLPVAAVGAQEGRIQAADRSLELSSGEPFVANDDLPAAEQAALTGALQHRRSDLTLGARWPARGRS
jgi:hypothetical protein